MAIVCRIYFRCIQFLDNNRKIFINNMSRHFMFNEIFRGDARGDV